MKKFLVYLALVIITLGGMLRLSIEFESAQDTALQQLARIGMIQAARGLPNPDSLRVFVCGSASPLGNSGRAQACIAVLTPNHFYIIDSGAGSSANISRAGLPFSRLQGVFITHFHSDHIAELYELNLTSWVRGRPEKLTVFGPKGIRGVINGTNATYSLDRDYRITHHGEAILKPGLGLIKSKTIKPGVILEDGDLTVTAYIADHSPAEPAFGYRFDYRGRSVVVSGDSIVTDETRQIADNTDLLLHDALATPIVTSGAQAAEKAGLDNLSKIMTDVLDYHASTESLIELGHQINVGMIAFYHLVPAPGNILMDKVFERNLPDHYVVADDGDWFELPANSKEIKISHR